MQFSTTNNLVHWIASAVCFIIPVVLSFHGAYLDITIGAILNAIYLFAESKLV
jgi:hypothetical protein